MDGQGLQTRPEDQPQQQANIDEKYVREILFS